MAVGTIPVMVVVRTAVERALHGGAAEGVVVPTPVVQEAVLAVAHVSPLPLLLLLLLRVMSSRASCLPDCDRLKDQSDSEI